MAVINGAKTVDEVAKTVKAGFGKVLRVRPRSPSRRRTHTAPRGVIVMVLATQILTSFGSSPG